MQIPSSFRDNTLRNYAASRYTVTSNEMKQRNPLSAINGSLCVIPPYVCVNSIGRQSMSQTMWITLWSVSVSPWLAATAVAQLKRKATSSRASTDVWLWIKRSVRPKRSPLIAGKRRNRVTRLFTRALVMRAIQRELRDRWKPICLDVSGSAGVDVTSRKQKHMAVTRRC